MNLWPYKSRSMPVTPPISRVIKSCWQYVNCQHTNRSVFLFYLSCPMLAVNVGYIGAQRGARWSEQINWPGCGMLVIKISSPSMMILEVERRQRLLYLMLAIKTDVNLKYQCNTIYVYINVFIYCFNVVIIIKWKYNICQIILSWLLSKA
jgi:hypothetical protein